jgi:acetoin utilization protein AcuC
MIAIIHHKDYRKYDLGLDHPLIGDKPERTMRFFEEKNIFSYAKVFEPKHASKKDLLRVHEASFVQHIKNLSKTGGILSLDTPAPLGIYDAAALACGGSILAAKKLFEGFEYAINTLGGFHHASRNTSSGFCFFNDIAVAIEYVREKYGLNKFLIIDLDAHHANGTQDIYYNNPTVLKISFHQDGRTLYPGTGFIHEIGEGVGKGYTVNMPFLPGTSNESYLYAFEELMPFFVEEFEPQLIIYQSGVDTHHSDPLAQINLTLPIYYEFAKRIKKLSDNNCKKLLVLLGGGYNSIYSVKAYYNIVAALVGKKPIKEEEIKDPNLKENMERVKKLKETLSPYWSF